MSEVKCKQCGIEGVYEPFCSPECECDYLRSREKKRKRMTVFPESFDLTPVGEYEKLQAENERLRKQIKDAYYDGFDDCWNWTTATGLSPDRVDEHWEASQTKDLMEEK